MKSKVTAEIRVEEVDGEEITFRTPSLIVESHASWTGHDGSVVLKFDGNKSLTVPANLLIDAVKRCHFLPD